MKNQLKISNMGKFIYLGLASVLTCSLIKSTMGVINNEPNVSKLQDLITNPNILIPTQILLTVSTIACYAYVASLIFKKSKTEDETLNTKLKMK